jgi:hypothetical protein
MKQSETMHQLTKPPVLSIIRLEISVVEMHSGTMLNHGAEGKYRLSAKVQITAKLLSTAIHDITIFPSADSLDFLDA